MGVKTVVPKSRLFCRKVNQRTTTVDKAVSDGEENNVTVYTGKSMIFVSVL